MAADKACGYHVAPYVYDRVKALQFRLYYAQHNFSAKGRLSEANLDLAE